MDRKTALGWLVAASEVRAMHYRKAGEEGITLDTDKLLEELWDCTSDEAHNTADSLEDAVKCGYEWLREMRDGIP